MDILSDERDRSSLNIHHAGTKIDKHLADWMAAYAAAQGVSQSAVQRVALWRLRDDVQREEGAR